MDTTFSEWLVEQLRTQNISQAELARRSGLTRQAVGNYVNDPSRTPDNESAIAIARALRISPETVLRRTGLLPPTLPKGEATDQLNYLANIMDDDTLRAWLEYGQYLLDKKEKADKSQRSERGVEHLKEN